MWPDGELENLVKNSANLEKIRQVLDMQSINFNSPSRSCSKCSLSVRMSLQLPLHSDITTFYLSPQFQLFPPFFTTLSRQVEIIKLFASFTNFFQFLLRYQYGKKSMMRKINTEPSRIACNAATVAFFSVSSWTSSNAAPTVRVNERRPIN